MIVRVKENYKRVGDENLLTVKRKGNTYIKHVQREYDKINELYDNTGKLKGIDIIKVSPDEIEAIYNEDKGTTIVLIKDSKGRKFKGVAKCMRTDTYNPTTGYSIAYSRARIKQGEDMIKRLSK